MNSVLLLFLVIGRIGRIGIMGSMDVEIDLLKERMDIARTDSVAERVFHVGELEGIECVCAKAGIGKVNAAFTAEILVMEYNVDILIFMGVAGGINPELEIGNLVISKKVVNHDLGKVVPEGFIPWDTVGYHADSMLIRIAEQAAYNIEFRAIPREVTGEEEHLPQVVLGCVVTGDQFIASEAKRIWLEETFNAECVEMEGAAVAQVCQITGTPFVIVRSLSDLANEDADVDFEAFVQYAAKNSAVLVGEMLRFLRD
jgi:adenosylhomocysteine nucleosidase